MAGKKEEARKNRIYKDGLYYHPTKKGIVVAINPYSASTNRHKQL